MESRLQPAGLTLRPSASEHFTIIKVASVGPAEAGTPYSGVSGFSDTLETFLKKSFAFFPDTGKNIGVCIIIQCQSVDF